MYVICVYDVNEKRCVKVMNLMRKYLFHIQNSVFEGELTPRQFKELEKLVTSIILDEDDVRFFFTYNDKNMNIKVVNKEPKIKNIIT